MTFLFKPGDLSASFTPLRLAQRTTGYGGRKRHDLKNPRPRVTVAVELAHNRLHSSSKVVAWTLIPCFIYPQCWLQQPKDVSPENGCTDICQNFGNALLKLECDATGCATPAVYGSERKKLPMPVGARKIGDQYKCLSVSM